jgi:Cu2+-exporting ATPase
MDHDAAHEHAGDQHSQGHPGSPTEQTAHDGPVDHPAGDDHAAHDKHRGHSPEMFRDRLLISLLLTVPILYFSPQIQEWFGYEAVTFPGSAWVTPVLATILYLYGGGPFLQGAVREWRRRQPGMMTLIAIAITVSYTYSVAVTLGLSGDDFYWELATLIDVMLLGHWIEMRSVVAASSALDELAALVPDEAHVVQDDGSIVDVPVSDLHGGERVVIRPGEQIPIDGEVIEGHSSVDEAFLTGESRPVSKEPGSEVVAGGINGQGALTAVVTRTGEKTTMSQILRLVEEAEASRSEYAVLADRAAMWLTIIAIGIAVPTLLIWLGIDDDPTFAITRAVTVLVIACPHALGLAVPLVNVNATGMAAENGLLVRNREAFERGRDIAIVAFDKTGTLTEGRFALSSMAAVGSESEALGIAAALERGSEHPLADAIVTAAEEDGVVIPTATLVSAVAGNGLEGSVDGMSYRIGRPEWAAELGAALSPEMTVALDEAAERGDSPVVLVEDGKVSAVLALADKVRAPAAAAIGALVEMDVEPVMITGDAEAVAATVAAELGIERYYARVLPAEKVEIVAELQKEGSVAFVGDGINDAPSLLTADLGMAIGAGTNVAIESADLVLVDDDPRDVVRALNLSRLTWSKMVQNLVWATGYNVIAIPLAAGIGVAVGILINPALGALFMSLSTVIVAINAMAMRRRRLL